jgi:aryl-alcohol dehydrogenase-like predicted oxidoreductase
VESAHRLVETLRAVADEKTASVAHLAIAWVLSRGEDVVPLVGARRRDQLAEALGAIDIELAPDDLDAIERAVPAGAAAGDRYHAPQMASLDSERGGTTAG